MRKGEKESERERGREGERENRVLDSKLALSVAGEDDLSNHSLYSHTAFSLNRSKYKRQLVGLQADVTERPRWVW
jgi:hypothetical protein